MLIDAAWPDAETETDVQIRDAVLALAAHDLKNPLGVIAGYVQVLQQRLADAPIPDAERVAGWLTQMSDAANRMAIQIDELLDLARLQARQPLDLRRSRTDLVMLVRRLADSCQQTTQRHHIRVCAKSPELIGHWDVARLERAVDNLLANAIKYSPRGGDITLTLAHEVAGGERWTVLTVQDQGIGVPAADLPHIFAWCQRANNVDSISGTGLGLASARLIIEQHGGTIAATSEVGRGATFIVRLPLA
jgi:signal transduction histidine kinase